MKVTAKWPWGCDRTLAEGVLQPETIPCLLIRSLLISVSPEVYVPGSYRGVTVTVDSTCTSTVTWKFAYPALVVLLYVVQVTLRLLLLLFLSTSFNDV